MAFEESQVSGLKDDTEQRQSLRYVFVDLKEYETFFTVHIFLFIIINYY